MKEEGWIGILGYRHAARVKALAATVEADPLPCKIGTCVEERVRKLEN